MLRSVCRILSQNFLQQRVALFISFRQFGSQQVMDETRTERAMFDLAFIRHIGSTKQTAKYEAQKEQLQ